MLQKLTVNDIRKKKGGEPIVTLTCYSYPHARILDEHVDILLVGDSLGMVIYGMESTLPVTLSMMIRHAKAVVKGSKKALVVVDMPFGTYQKSKYSAYENAAKLIAKSGATAVKIEGGVEMAETIEFITQRGIPVLGHIGLQPQHINNYGNYKFRGLDTEQRKKILADAIAIGKSGAFAVVVEGTEEGLSAEITKKIKIPTIGIGASKKCDGQVLVLEDMLGLNPDFKPKFVKTYANIKDVIDKAVGAFASDVKTRKFPTDENIVRKKSK